MCTFFPLVKPNDSIVPLFNFFEVAFDTSSAKETEEEEREETSTGCWGWGLTTLIADEFETLILVRKREEREEREKKGIQQQQHTRIK